MIYWISRKHPLSRQRKEVQGKLTYLGGSEMTTLLNPVFFNYSQVLSLSFSIPSLPLFLPTSSRPLSIYCISFSLGLWSQHSSIATEARMPATAGAYQLACWAALSCISLAKYMQSQNGAPVAGQLRGEMRQFEGGLIWAFHHFPYISKCSEWSIFFKACISVLLSLTCLADCQLPVHNQNPIL